MMLAHALWHLFKVLAALGLMVWSGTVMLGLCEPPSKRVIAAYALLAVSGLLLK